MKTYHLSFLVDSKEEIIFRSIYAHIEEREQGIFCSLEGEYLKENVSFNPPMRYKMSNIGVMTRDVVQIVKSIYHRLALERESDF